MPATWDSNKVAAKRFSFSRYITAVRTLPGKGSSWTFRAQTSQPIRFYLQWSKHCGLCPQADAQAHTGQPSTKTEFQSWHRVVLMQNKTSCLWGVRCAKSALKQQRFFCPSLWAHFGCVSVGYWISSSDVWFREITLKFPLKLKLYWNLHEPQTETNSANAIYLLIKRPLFTSLHFTSDRLVTIVMRKCFINNMMVLSCGLIQFADLMLWT